MKLKTAFVLFAIGVVILGGAACRHAAPPTSTGKPIYYICPMHPSVKVAQAGKCPLCGMKLIPAFTETDSGSAAPCGATACAVSGVTNKP